MHTRHGRFGTLATALLVGCAPAVAPAPPLPEAVPLVRSGFEAGVVAVPDDDPRDLRGADAVGPPPRDWVADLEADNPYAGDFSLQYQGGDPSQRYARIETDPVEGDRALHFALLAPNVDAALGGPKGRVQANLYGNRGLTAATIVASVLLGTGFARLEAAAATFSWLTLWEFWDAPNWTGDPAPFRVSLNVVKTEAAAGAPLFLAAHGQRYDGRWRTLWEVVGREPVPVGRWWRVRIRLAEGDAASGRLVVETLGDEGPRTLLAVRDWTRHPDGPPGRGYTHVNPFKLYTAAELVEALAPTGGLHVWWDDVELWAGWDDRPDF